MLKTFEIYIKQKITVHAESEDFAKELIIGEPPFLDVCGGHVEMGIFDYKTDENIEILEIKEIKEIK